MKLLDDGILDTFASIDAKASARSDFTSVVRWNAQSALDLPEIGELIGT